MSVNITEANKQMYSDNVQLLSQQKGSRLRGSVRVEKQGGINAFYDQIGAVTAVPLTDRHADTPQSDTPHSRRRVSLVPYVHNDFIDRPDKVRTMHEWNSEYVVNGGFAMGRAIDDVIIAAALGTAYTGETGSTSQANTQSIATSVGGADTNMNIAKLRATKELFDAADVDPSLKRYIAFGSSQLENLLTETEVTSSDYNTVKALVQGEVDQFLGFTFIRTERLSETAGDVRHCIAWVEDGILLSIGEDVVTKIDERADKNYLTQVYHRMDIGATRMEEVKVVEILCDET